MGKITTKSSERWEESTCEYSCADSATASKSNDALNLVDNSMVLHFGSYQFFESALIAECFREAQ